MTGQDISQYPRDDEIDLLQLIRVVWQKRLMVIISMAVALSVAILYLHIATYKYTATLVVTPVDKGAGGLSSKLGGLAGLATVAGISLPQDQGGDYFQLYMESYKTRQIAQVLSEDQKIMTYLFANEWSARQQKFREPMSASRDVKKLIKKFLGFRVYPWRKPDAARLQQYIKKNITVTQDKKTSLVTVTYNHKDSNFAGYFLKRLHETADNGIRLRAKSRAEESISYLSQQVQVVTLAEHRAALAQSLSEQEKIRMMANSKLSFSADAIEDPVVSISPTSPKPALILALSLMVGVFLGLLLVFVQYQLAHYRAQHAAAG